MLRLQPQPVLQGLQFHALLLQGPQPLLQLRFLPESHGSQPQAAFRQQQFQVLQQLFQLHFLPLFMALLR